MNKSHIEYCVVKLQGHPGHSGWKAMKQNIELMREEISIRYVQYLVYSYIYTLAVILCLCSNIRQVAHGIVKVEGYLYFALLMRVLNLQWPSKTKHMRTIY
eukprot:420525_1